MQQDDFIKINIEKELIKLGNSRRVSSKCATQAVDEWKKHSGVKGSMFKHLLDRAKKAAKLMKVK